MRRLSWEKYEGVVKGLANSLSSSERELPDLIGEGALAYVEARKSFDGDKGEFSTHLWWQCVGRMRHFKKKAATNPHIDCDIPDIAFGSQPARQESWVGFKQFLESLSEEAGEVVRVIFESPAELYEYSSQKGLSPRALARFFTKERGWGYAKVWAACDEIKHKLKQL